MFESKFSKICALLLVCGIFFSACPVSYAMLGEPNLTKQENDVDEDAKQERKDDEQRRVIINFDYNHNGDNVFPNSRGWELRYIPLDKEPERDTKENEKDSDTGCVQTGTYHQTIGRKG